MGRQTSCLPPQNRFAWSRGRAQDAVEPVGGRIMVGRRGRVLILSDQRAFACLVVLLAERTGLAARVLSHALDFSYITNHWCPDVVIVQMGMPDQQDVEVLEQLEGARYPGRVLLVGDVKLSALKEAADVARSRGLAVASVLPMHATRTEIEAVLKQSLALRDAA